MEMYSVSDVSAKVKSNVYLVVLKVITPTCLALYMYMIGMYDANFSLAATPKLMWLHIDYSCSDRMSWSLTGWKHTSQLPYCSHDPQQIRCLTIDHMTVQCTVTVCWYSELLFCCNSTKSCNWGTMAGQRVSTFVIPSSHQPAEYFFLFHVFFIVQFNAQCFSAMYVITGLAYIHAYIFIYMQ